MSANLVNILWQGTWQTLYMLTISGLMAVLIGTPLGMILLATRSKSFSENKIINKVLGFTIDVTRSVPFVILLIALLPFTRFIVGTSIGTSAAIVPLSIAAIPFMARVVENALIEVHPGLIEMGHALGATPKQIIFKILLPESLPAITNGITLMLISLVGYSAMAGAVGGGGLGTVAINYGYQRFDTKIMIATILILIMIVWLVQFIGTRISRRLQH